MKVLKDLFLDELADMYDAEKRILKALPKMAKAAHHSDLAAAFTGHLKQTEGHVQKLEEVFAAFDEKPKGKTCEATVGLLKEGESIMSEFKDSPALDAALISAGQKVEHYEITSYGSLRTWARLLGNDRAVILIGDILGEEKAADDKLTEIGEKCNSEAVGDKDPGNGHNAETSKLKAKVAIH